MNEFETKITNITTDLADTLIAKNHDYGNAFHDNVNEFGNTAMLIVLKNKYNRLKTLLNSDSQVDESIRDTLLDLAGYAILAINEIDNQTNK
ncbi:nucleotide modification associated domain-containing protein [Lapidilactobacillus bayanensis]|uniref:nucleotide modification associated domain-containing protein n=1 Tax=Lapidilactobacillus bayanensis TaxID=2485998 RepID=UPI000F7B05F1|nr:nucleotide modification associated domain-containing protein [Lapidilactobacillus bayanensis]